MGQKNKTSLLKKASLQQMRTQTEMKRERFNSRPGMVSYLDEKEANMGRQRIVEGLMSKWNAQLSAQKLPHQKQRSPLQHSEIPYSSQKIIKNHKIKKNSTSQIQYRRLPGELTHLKGGLTNIVPVKDTILSKEKNWISLHNSKVDTSTTKTRYPSNQDLSTAFNQASKQNCQSPGEASSRKDVMKTEMKNSNESVKVQESLEESNHKMAARTAQNFEYGDSKPQVQKSNRNDKQEIINIKLNKIGLLEQNITNTTGFDKHDAQSGKAAIYRNVENKQMKNERRRHQRS